MGLLKQIIIIGLLLFSTCTSLYAQKQISTQGHDGPVTAIAVATVSGRKVVYTGGDDGFLIRWNSNGTGEHFQISDNSIRMIAVHPNGNDIAVYESDGLTVNRLSVWNWQTLTKKFPSKRLDSTITSLSYTARGSQIMVGQANVMGILFIDSAKGTVLSNKIKETSGSITFSQTSSSENSSVMYSALGYIIYTNLRNGMKKASFKVDNNLQNPFVFNNDVIFAGKQGNSIHLYNSTTGEILEKINVNNPFIATSKSDTNLYYFETDGKNSTLKMIEVKNGFINTTPVILKQFTFQTWDTPTVAVKHTNTIYIGMKSGELYSVDVSASTQIAAANKITEKVYEKIYDVVQDSSDFYFITDTSIFKSQYNNKDTNEVAKISGYTNLIIEDDFLYVWSKSTRKPVVKIGISDNSQTTLFTPTNSLEALRLQDESLLALEGSSKVSLYDLENNTMNTIYNGTGIQDVLLYKDSIYVAKTAASNPQSALIQVNINTRETIPINIRGEVSFSLAESQTSTGPFYGASIVYENNTSTTKVFSYNPNTKSYSIILSLSDEDPKAFTYLHNGVLYTNIGRSQIYAVTLSQKQLVKLDQAASLPLKVVADRTVLAVLNKDGSISWYNAQTKKLVKNWYITLDQRWLEF